MADGVCAGFEPQNYLRDRCRKCFRVRAKHDQPAPASSPEHMSLSPTSSVSHKKERRRSWRDRNPDEGPDNEVPDNVTETSSVASFKSAHSKLLSTAKSIESLSSNVDDRSMITAASGSLEFDQEDDRCITPTEVSNFDLIQLKSENLRLQEQVNKLKEERKSWISKRPGQVNPNEDQSAIQMLEERLAAAEALIQDYRDENIALKCELREVNEGGKVGQMSDRLRAAEELCDDLMTDNEKLQKEVRDLQTDVEEMTDKYREQEIDEFREMQRELEQNAKSCRVLQFKLKKSERQREQLQTENDVLLMKLKQKGVEEEEEEADLDENASTATTSEGSHTNRVRELESELRIAKEVSHRLHKELETAEEKRYKLEGDVFYYKEKLREQQTQNKWRETKSREKSDAAKRQSVELPEDLSSIDCAKELLNVMERETDLKEQLKFTEEDLQRTRSQLSELEHENEELMRKLVRLNDVTATKNALAKKPGITRSISEGDDDVRLQLANNELQQLGARCDALERKNNSLTKKMVDLEMDTARKLQSIDADIDKDGSLKLNAEIEKDIGRLMTRIHELEQRNSELQIQMRKAILNDTNSSRDKAASIELREERQQRKELEAELTEYKQLIAKSDNPRLIAMATKVELLTNQLNMATERANAVHKRALKEEAGSEGYADSLKQRVEALERQNGELLAKAVFQVQPEKNASTNPPSAEDIEHCCVVLASVEAHTNRLCKQLDRIDNSQKEERRRSLSKESTASLAADLASVMAELKVIHKIMEAHKAPGTGTASGGEPSKAEPEQKTCSECQAHQKTAEDLREEVAFYKKKNKELTNQVLQTEDRWTVEIEKQTHSYVTKIRLMENEVSQLKTQLQEQLEVANAQSVSLSEKSKTIEEQQARATQLEVELVDKQRSIQDLEREHRALKEWEIKYHKMEDMYQKEKSKTDAEKAKLKTEVTAMKKRGDDLSTELETTKNEQQNREVFWSDKKKLLEREVAALKKKLRQPNSTTAKTEEEEEEEEEDVSDLLTQSSSLRSPTPVVRSINFRVTRINDLGVPELKEKLLDQQQKYSELDGRFMQLKLGRESLEGELQRLKDTVEKERSDFQHRARQNEKIRSFEMDALQQKFTSRMNIMENTNKSLHTQLVQIRRERDRFRDAMNTTENKLLDEQRNLDAERKRVSSLTAHGLELEKTVKNLKAEMERVALELKLTIDASRADKKLWQVERKHLLNGTPSNEDAKDVRITQDALNAAEAVQKQYAEYQKFYTKEVSRLKDKIKELNNLITNKESEFQRKAIELADQIKILEIDQKNLMQAKQMQMSATEVLKADQDRLMQIVQQSEIQKLTRKYKVTAIIDRLQTIQSLTDDTEISHIINQLSIIKEEDSQTAFTSTDLGDYEVDSAMSSARNLHQAGLMLSSQRSLSIESSSTWESRFLDGTTRSVSPVKKLVAYPDPPPSFLVNSQSRVQYDGEGRLHYLANGRADASRTTCGGAPTRSTGTLTDDTDVDNDSLASHGRLGSAGTNVLYRIRREELAKGTAPSVRAMAKAFDNLDRPKAKRGFFNVRKSRSVDNHEDKPPQPTLPSKMARTTTSMSRIELDLPGTAHKPVSSNSVAHYGTLSRGGRNPFKNMGSKLVDRVRRSLSRSGRSRDASPEKAPLAEVEDTSPQEETAVTVTSQTKPPKKIRVKKSTNANGDSTKLTKKKPTAV